VKKLVFEYWGPVVVWLITIFFFSTDRFSASETSRVVIPVLTLLFPQLSPAELDLWHGVVRKFSHVAEYFILATFTYRSLKYTQQDLAQSKLRTITLVLFAAILDELHQGLTMSRTPSLVDVGYDCVGGVWALWLITGYETWRLRSHPVL
jgi:VanZ family protein